MFKVKYGTEQWNETNLDSTFYYILNYYFGRICMRNNYITYSNLWFIYLKCIL